MDNVVVRCNCNCSFLSFDKDKNDNIWYITSYMNTCFTEQINIWAVIKERIKMAWYALIGRKYYLFDIVLDQKTMEYLVEQLKKRV